MSWLVKVSRQARIRRKGADVVISSRSFSLSFKKSTSNKASENLDQPIAFSKSEAAKSSGYSSFRNTHNDIPWYQPLSISLSISAILIWFCVLREENDVDQKISMSLYDRIEGLEKKQLELYVQNQAGNSSENIELVKQRLSELTSESGK